MALPNFGWAGADGAARIAVPEITQSSFLGGNGADLLLGGDGNDFIDGNQGNDTAFLGAGDAVFKWDPGDGSDTVEGQDGFDTLLFNGANVGEVFALSANGERALLTRDIGNIVMDLNGLEKVTVIALGGPDTITINDLSGTDVTQINVNLVSASGSGDGQRDTVVINGTEGDDVIVAAGSNGTATVFGLAARVTTSGLEAANDKMVVNALAGDDVVDASGLGAGIPITINGGDGDDVLIGGDDADTLNGEAGDDVLIGGLGIDLLDGGPGNNVLLQ